jgi:hypothetical protein
MLSACGYVLFIDSVEHVYTFTYFRLLRIHDFLPIISLQFLEGLGYVKFICLTHAICIKLLTNCIYRLNPHIILLPNDLDMLCCDYVLLISF